MHSYLTLRHLVGKICTSRWANVVPRLVSNFEQSCLIKLSFVINAFIRRTAMTSITGDFNKRPNAIPWARWFVCQFMKMEA